MRARGRGIADIDHNDSLLQEYVVVGKSSRVEAVL
jgi:hypothetical protein